MLVSDDHKLVFVHIQKTGGSTVQRLLEKHIPDLRSILTRHDFASRGMQELEGWNDYFRFAFVRNPWDRLVSWYSMVTTYPRGGNQLWRYVRENSSTFEEFIYNCTDEVKIKKGVYYSFAYNQLDYVTDESGDLLVDFIGKLENFERDLPEVFSRIGLELEAIPRKNSSDHRHYSAFYAPDTEMIVRERFKRDIEYFGYEFERPDTLQGSQVMEKVSTASGRVAQRSIEVEVNGRRQTGVGTQEARDKPPGLLFVCGCDEDGTTLLADYLNRHPEILISPERSGTTQRGEIATLEGMLGAREIGEPAPDKNPAGLRWIGEKDADFMRRMESVAGDNPGARFIVMYRPIEDIAESWETKDTGGQNGNDGFGQAVKAWNRSLQGTRRFVRDSLLPRVLIVSYDDFLYRKETVVPLISRFLGLELDEPAQPHERGRAGEPLGKEKRSLIEKHANRAAEAWLLDRVDKQWERPGLYVQKTSKTALATSLNEMEARTWRLQQKVRELERDRERRRRRFRQLKSSRTWKLVNKISGLRARITGR